MPTSRQSLPIPWHCGGRRKFKPRGNVVCLLSSDTKEATQLIMRFIICLLCIVSILALSLGFSPRTSSKKYVANNIISSSTSLFAGFGKAPVKEDENVNPMTQDGKCACGSKFEYDECCGPLHMTQLCFTSPSALIQSRFSAYKMNNIPYIIATTSDQSPDYTFYTESPGGAQKNMKKWARDIAATMTRDYWYVRYEIDSEEADQQHEDIVNISWRLLAIHKASNVMYPISEKSTVIKEDEGGWKYVLGEVTRPSADVMQTMMETWPAEAGIELKQMNEQYERQLDAEAGMTDIATGKGLAEKVGEQGIDGMDAIAPNRAAAAAAAMKKPRPREGPNRRSNPMGGAFAKSIPRK